MSKCQCNPDVFQIKTKAEDFFHSLPKGHVIYTLMTEHFKIREFIDELEQIITKLMPLESINDHRDLLTRLEFLARHISSTRRHYIREEITLIQRLEILGIRNPAIEIRQQHDAMSVEKQRMSNLIHQFYVTPFTDFKDSLRDVSLQLIADLRNHIDTEDTVLYPQLIENIRSDQEWAEIKAECDRIGYNCFTPFKN